MKSACSLLLGITVLAALGCRSRPEQRAVMDSYQEELRRYEGIIYDLEYNKEVLTSENERLKKRAADPAAAERDALQNRSLLFPPRTTAPSTAPLGTARPGRLTPVPGSRATPPSGSGVPDDFDLSPPVIEHGPTIDVPPSRRPATNKKPALPFAAGGRKTPNAAEPESETPLLNPADDDVGEPTMEAEGESPDEPPSDPPSINSLPPSPPNSISHEHKDQAPLPFRKPTLDGALPAPVRKPSSVPELLPEPSSTRAEPQDKKVTQIFVDPHYTRGLDLDRNSGDDGLRVVIEPRNSAGEFVPATGKISVVLLDPALQGEAARLGRWEFDSEVVRYQLRLAGKRNIPLELPWTGRTPTNSQLTVFVRLETEDGAKLETSEHVNVQLAGQISSRWTPRPAQRRGPLTRQTEVASLPTHERSPREAIAPAGFTPDGADDSDPIDAAAEPTAAVPEWSPSR